MYGYSYRLGAASGFGAAIAKRFAQEGAKVCVADLNESAGREFASSMPDSLYFHRLNVTQRKDWDSVVEKMYSDYGKIDCLVNNAGTTYSNKARCPGASNISAINELTHLAHVGSDRG